MQLLAKDMICVRCLKATITSDPSHICDGVSRIRENGLSSEIPTDCHQRCRQRGVNLHHSICLTCIEAKQPRLTNYMKAISARATLRDCVIPHRPPPDPNTGSNQGTNPARPTDHNPPPRTRSRPPREPEPKPETGAHHSMCLTCIEATHPRLTNYIKAISARTTLRNCVTPYRPPSDPNTGSSQRTNPARPTDHNPPPQTHSRPPEEPEPKPETSAKEDRHPWTKIKLNTTQSPAQRNREPQATPPDITSPRKRTHTPKRVCSPRDPLPLS